MFTVGQLAQNLLSLEPQKNPARLAFYHYVKNFLNLDDEFRQDMLDAFYDRALGLQYWQVNKNVLGEMVKGDLLAIAARNGFSFDINQVVHSNEMQVVVLEQTRDFAALLSREVAKMEKNEEKVKTFRMNAEKNSQVFEVMFVRLQPTGSVIVEIRQNTALLLDGEMNLIRPHSRLTYTPELDFEPQIDQVLTTSLMQVARFRLNGLRQTVSGHYIQGPSFHKTESFGTEKTERKISDVPELFQAIKKVERYYINPVTDPYYQHMMENFEQAFHEKNQTY